MTANLISLTDPASLAAEAYRRLRVNLLSAGRESPLKTLLIVATTADPEKASTVANLAVAFARVGKRVIAADCDLRQPAMHMLFGLDNTAGVTTAVNNVAASLPLRDTEVAGLRVLCSGPSVDVPSDLLASPAMGELITRMGEEADLVLLDAPPALSATDAVELATQVDGVLLTVRAGHTRREEAQRVKEQLEKVGARVVGAALLNAGA